MKTTALTIIIPGEIVSLPDLTIAERVALAHLHNFPGCSNGRLARLLGLSMRGVESMRRRLRERRLIEQIGKGRARVHLLMFHVNRHTKCDEVKSAESHTKSGEHQLVESHFSGGQGTPPHANRPVPAPTQTTSPVRSVAISVDEERERAGDCIARADFEGALHHYQLAKQRVEDFPETMLEVRVEALALVIEDETRVLAGKLVFDHAAATKVPAAKLNALFVVIKDLSAERLAQIRPALDAQARLGTPADISALLAGDTGHRQ
jgi:hypothetical protein